MRTECYRAIEELALTDPKVVVVASDPNSDFMTELGSKCPDRLMIEGVCEQALVGVSAGLASEGFYPYIIMLSVFGTRRCYEQLLLDFGLHGLAGCMVGAGGGLTYAALGPTHIAVDDLLLSSAVPGSAVLTPAEPNEAVRLAQLAREHSGLSYLRLTGTTESFVNCRGDVSWGRGRLLSDPGPVLFISCGTASLAVEPAVKALGESGIRAGAIHLHTLKPLDVDLIRRHAASAEAVICVDEHRKIGGLSSAVLHALMNTDPSIAPLRFATVGVDDEFPLGYGSYEDLMEHYGITGASLAQRARDLLDRNKKQLLLRRWADETTI